MDSQQYRTFTPVQQQALYNLARLSQIIFEVANDDFSTAEAVANAGIKLAVAAKSLLDEIEATPPPGSAAPVLPPGGYTVERVHGRLVWKVMSPGGGEYERHDNPYTAESHANRLNKRASGERGVQGSAMRPEHTEMTSDEYAAMMFPELYAEREARKQAANPAAGSEGAES